MSHHEQPLASFMLTVIAEFINVIDDILENETNEEGSIKNVQEDILSMAKWLSEHPDIDKEMGSHAANFIKEAKKAEDLGVDFYATLTDADDATENKSEDE